MSDVASIRSDNLEKSPDVTPEQQNIILQATEVARQLWRKSPTDDVEGHSFEGDDDEMRAVSINCACACA